MSDSGADSGAPRSFTAPGGVIVKRGVDLGVDGLAFGVRGRAPAAAPRGGASADRRVTRRAAAGAGIGRPGSAFSAPRSASSTRATSRAPSASAYSRARWHGLPHRLLPGLAVGGRVGAQRPPGAVDAGEFEVGEAGGEFAQGGEVGEFGGEWTRPW